MEVACGMAFGDDVVDLNLCVKDGGSLCYLL